MAWGRALHPLSTCWISTQTLCSGLFFLFFFFFYSWAPVHTSGCPHCPLGCRCLARPAEATTVRPGPRPRPSLWQGGREAGVGRQMAEPGCSRPMKVAGKNPLDARLLAFWKITPERRPSPSRGAFREGAWPPVRPSRSADASGPARAMHPGAVRAVRCLLQRPIRYAHQQRLLHRLQTMFLQIRHNTVEGKSRLPPGPRAVWGAPLLPGPRGSPHVPHVQGGEWCVSTVPV